MKKRFLEICRQNINREGINELLEWLEKTDFYTAPASTKYHGNFESGLLKHSLAVYDRLVNNSELRNINIETLTIVSLFHDLCKVNFYKTDYKNAKNENGVWEKVPYYVIDEKFPFGHGEKSAYILSQFLKLSTQECLAVRWHMGGFDDTAKNNSAILSNVFNSCPLALYLHIADLQASFADKV